MGGVLLAAWLAYDDVQRLPNWLLLSLPVLLIVLVRWPRLLLLLIPALVVAFICDGCCRQVCAAAIVWLDGRAAVRRGL